MKSLPLILVFLSYTLAMPTTSNHSISSKILLNCPKELKPFSAHGLNSSAIRLRAIGPWTWVDKKGKSSYYLHLF